MDVHLDLRNQEFLLQNLLNFDILFVQEPLSHYIHLNPKTSTQLFVSDTYPYKVGLLPANPIRSCDIYISLHRLSSSGIGCNTTLFYYPHTALDSGTDNYLKERVLQNYIFFSRKSHF